MAMGNMGGMPNSTDRTSGAMKPTARPHGPPSTKPHSRMGKCIGHSMLPTCGTWPVIMGSTKASARNSAASTRLRVVEWGFVFIKSFLLWPDKKRGLPGLQANGRPLRGVCKKIRWQGLDRPAAPRTCAGRGCSAQIEKTGFCLRIRLPAGICEKYSRCLWLCQDTAKSLQFNQKAANFNEYFPACVHFA